jgi:tRNA ligase
VAAFLNESTDVVSFLNMNPEQLVNSLKALTIGSRKLQAVRTKDYLFQPSPQENYTITSYNIKEHVYRSGTLPVMARGLFTRYVNGKQEICIRGYDKFFNIGEVPQTKWSFLEQNTKGPYEMTLKENGCIIYVSAVEGHILVTSKHSLGKMEGRVSHAQKGEEWLHLHLKKSGKSAKDLADYLGKEKLTAVFELADDEFEEHVLAYPKEKSGLYVHGLNDNQAEFRSRPFSEVEAFGKQFGFWIVKMFELPSIQDVKQFSEECAKTGTYENVPVEGFVVRCTRTDSDQIHFFKIKFEEPYLMFREWREVTRVLLSGKRKPRCRFKLTERYVSWCTAQIRQYPHIFKEFNQNKGIIYVRNRFLVDELGMSEFSGIDLKDFCETTDLDPNFGAEKCLIIPVATIGVGKTTLARTLTNLYPDLIGHIQNDNIAQKRAAEAFEQAIMDSFRSYDIVIADRNNHLSQHRDGLSTAFKTEYPGGKIIALDWGVDYMDKKSLLELTAKRVEERGENHQSLTPGRTKDYKRILASFIHHRDPIDTDTTSDSRIDTVFDLGIQNSIRQNVQTIIEGLSLENRSDAEMNQAFMDAKSFKESFKKEVKSTKERKPQYYGIKIQSGLTDLIEKAILVSEFKEGWPLLKPHVKLGAQKGFHSTITLRSLHPQMTKEFDTRWKQYKDNQQDKDDPLKINATVKLVTSRLVWNDRIMALEIQSTDPPYESMNRYKHVTIATLNSSVKASESNSLLEEYHDKKIGKSVELKTTAEGTIAGFFY